MNLTVSLQLPTQSVNHATAIASRTNRRLEDVLAEWIDQAVSRMPVQALPDEQILALTDSQLPLNDQNTFSQLLTGNREGTLSSSEKNELDQMMKCYRRGVVRKAQALNEAVSRGLILSLN